MPLFLDTHHASELAPELIREFLRHAQSATRDEFGVRAIDVYCGDDGRLFCIVSAPDETSIRRQHAQHNVVCRRVRRVESQRATEDGLSDAEKTTIRHMIAAEHAWPAEAVS